MPTLTSWTIGATDDVVTTHDDVPPGRMRDRLRRDAARWSKQGLTFEGVTCDLLPGTVDCYVVKGDGYELRTTAGNGYWPVDALARASQADWTEIN